MSGRTMTEKPSIGAAPRLETAPATPAKAPCRRPTTHPTASEVSSPEPKATHRPIGNSPAMSAPEAAPSLPTSPK